MPKQHEFDRQDRKGAIIAEIRRVASALGKKPTIVEFKRIEAGVSYDEVIGQFGTWNSAIAAADLQANPTRRPPSNRIDRAMLIDEFIRVANLLGAIPSRPIFSAMAKISRSPYQKTFGSWAKAVTAIVSEHADRLSFIPAMPITDTLGRAKRKPLNLGLPLESCPTNEQETIILFAFLAERLGFEIVSAQIQFPDLTLRKNGELILAEVEFLSSTYLDHGHPIGPQYLCICWRRNRDIPGIAGIMALEEVVRSLPNQALLPTRADKETQ